MPRPIAALLIVLALTLAACGDSIASGADPTEAVRTSEATSDTVPDTAEAATVRIAVTTSILGDVVSQLVAEDAEVEVVMPRGADPHSFQPSAAQAEAMRTADLLIVNGANAEEAMLDVIAAAEGDGVRTFEAISAVDTIAFTDEHDDEHGDDEADEAHTDDEAGHDDHEGDDPHFWQDPGRMADVVTAMAAEIAEVDAGLADEEWAQRGAALAEEMMALDAEVEEILSVIPDERRILVTNHEAFGYLADRYDFEILGTVVPGGSTLAEPSASGLEFLVATIEEAGVTAIFAENTNPSALADAVAAEIGSTVQVALLYSDSLSDTDEEAGTYADYLRANARTIADALTAG